jgi:hypothetical protein
MKRSHNDGMDVDEEVVGVCANQYVEVSEGDKDSEGFEGGFEGNESKRRRVSKHNDWAQHLCRALLGSRDLFSDCVAALERIEADIKSGATKEAPMLAATCPETQEGLVLARRLLLRAVQYLAARCRQLQSCASANAVVKAELAERLEASLVEEQRLRREHGILQEQVRLALAYVAGAPYVTPPPLI